MSILAASGGTHNSVFAQMQRDGTIKGSFEKPLGLSAMCSEAVDILKAKMPRELEAPAK